MCAALPTYFNSNCFMHCSPTNQLPGTGKQLLVLWLQRYCNKQTVDNHFKHTQKSHMCKLQAMSHVKRLTLLQGTEAIIHMIFQCWY